MIEILHRYTNAVIYQSDLAKNAKEAVVEAVRDGANLSAASLALANLVCANLTGANLSRADLAWANLTGANLSRADLAWANLRGANLSRADLAWADLTGANLADAEGLLSRPVRPLQIGGSRHLVIVRQDGYVTIGCQHRLLTDWEEDYEESGKKASYSDAEIAEYKLHIRHCREWMEMHGVVDPIANLAEWTRGTK